MTISGLARIKALLDQMLEAQSEDETSDEIMLDNISAMGINPPPAHDLDDISRYDGTAGFSNRPDFIREEDERTGIKWHGTT